MSTFKEDVIAGLSKKQKSLSPKYFYDEAGDKLFQQIMELEEYYLPRLEREIINEKSDAISQILKSHDKEIEVIELGAGDGTKTVRLLKSLDDAGLKIIYIPLDISPNILEVNKINVENLLPNVEVKPIAGDYFKTFPLFTHDGEPKLVMFMGSNIGNYDEEGSVSFLSMLKSNLIEGDYILVAIDLKKHPKTILGAYNDSKGVTKSFNLNLLARINRELGANFDLGSFDHYPTYDPDTGNALSFLVSTRKQTVEFDGGEKVEFERNEVIHTEISKKYSLSEIDTLAQKSGLEVVNHFTDELSHYSLSLLRVGE